VGVARIREALPSIREHEIGYANSDCTFGPRPFFGRAKEEGRRPMADTKPVVEGDQPEYLGRAEK
jgi:hypothetical protein